MQASIIIAYYRKIDNLKLILHAFSNQTDNDFEVIIAEDDNNLQTKTFIQISKQQYRFPIIHLFQDKDDGFRKNIILNRAIKASNADKIIFIDGDCIPNKHFVASYNKAIKQGIMCYGRRVFLDKTLSDKLLKQVSVRNLNFLSILFSNSMKKKESIYFPLFRLSIKKRNLLGCNWGILRKHLLEVNGFDEDYAHAGVGEDVDIEWRLTASGIKKYSMKNKAILYHLYHERIYSEDGVKNNYKLLEQKKQMNEIKCKNGIQKLF